MEYVYKKPHYKVFNGLQAMTEAEALRYEDELPTAGVQRAGGVGLIRVDKSRDIDWVFVRCSTLPKQNCQYCGSEMSLSKVADTSNFHLELALFYSCSELILPDLTCGNNSYVVYPQHQAFNDEANPNLQVCIIKWESKEAAYLADPNRSMDLFPL
jgi:hypothetical protein